MTQTQCVFHTLPLLIVHPSSYHHSFDGGEWMTLAGPWWKSKWPHSWCFQHVIPFCWCYLNEILETLEVAPNWRRWHTGLGSWVYCSPACFLLLARSLCLLPAMVWTADLCHMFPLPPCPAQAYGVSAHGWTFWSVSWRRPSLSCFSWVFWSQRCKSNEHKQEDCEQSCWDWGIISPYPRVHRADESMRSHVTSIV